MVASDPFYSHHGGYKFKLVVTSLAAYFTTYLSLIEGEYDNELSWPMKCKVNLELLNQAGDHEHIVARQDMTWTKDIYEIPVYLLHNMRYSHLEIERPGVQYVMNDCIKFRIHTTSCTLGFMITSIFVTIQIL